MFETMDFETFHERGLLYCKDFLPQDKVKQAQEIMFQQLETRGIRRDGQWHAQDIQPAARGKFTKEVRKATKQSPAMKALQVGEAPQAISALLDGRPVYPMELFPSLLFTLPDAQSWVVPHSAWHLDAPRLTLPGPPGVQIFTFLERVVPGGGGTLVVAGSHRFVNEGRRLSSQDVKKRLKRLPYFEALMAKDTADRQHFLEQPTVVDDVELQVIELHGDPGDVYFMDLRLLHTISPNITTTPRIMLTQRFLLEDAYRAIFRTDP